ncbi:MAG: hypothetical protein ACE5PV_01075 [Candidatus Poribacteria bacterium]
MKLTNRQEWLIEKVVSKIMKIDPKAFVKVTLDTYEDEDVDIRVYTNKTSSEIYEQTVPLTLDILDDEGFYILVIALPKESLVNA